MRLNSKTVNDIWNRYWHFPYCPYMGYVKSGSIISNELYALNISCIPL